MVPRNRTYMQQIDGIVRPTLSLPWGRRRSRRSSPVDVSYSSGSRDIYATRSSLSVGYNLPSKCQLLLLQTGFPSFCDYVSMKY